MHPSDPVLSSVRNPALWGMFPTGSIPVRQVDATVCPRCGQAVHQARRGRPAVWCSQRCRRAAYEERRAAAAGAIAVQVVEKVDTRTVEHDLSECAARVAGSPAACRRVVQQLTELIRTGELERDQRWSSTANAVANLVDALTTRTRRPWSDR